MPAESLNSGGIFYPAVNFVLRKFGASLELSYVAADTGDLLKTVRQGFSIVESARRARSKKAHLLSPFEKVGIDEAIRGTQNALEFLADLIGRSDRGGSIRQNRKGSRRRNSRGAADPSDIATALKKVMIESQALQKQIAVMNSRTEERLSWDSRKDTPHDHISRRKTVGPSMVSPPPPSYAQATWSTSNKEHQQLPGDWPTRPHPTIASFTRSVTEPVPSSYAPNATEHVPARSVFDQLLSKSPESQQSQTLPSLSPRLREDLRMPAAAELPQPASLPASAERLAPLPTLADPEAMSATINNIAEYVQFTQDILASLSQSRKPSPSGPSGRAQTGPTLRRPFPVLNAPPTAVRHQ